MVDVIATHKFPGGDFDVIVRNNTPQVIHNAVVAIDVRDASGRLIASSSTTNTTPATIGPGRIAMTGAGMSSADPPADAVYKFTTSFDPGVATDRIDGTITEVNEVPGQYGGISIVGTFKNPASAVMQLPHVTAACWDAGGTFIGEVQGFPQADRLSPGATTSFEASTGTKQCPAFVIGAEGYTY